MYVSDYLTQIRKRMQLLLVRSNQEDSLKRVFLAGMFSRASTNVRSTSGQWPIICFFGLASTEVYD